MQKPKEEVGWHRKRAQKKLQCGDIISSGGDNLHLILILPDDKIRWKYSSGSVLKFVLQYVKCETPKLHEKNIVQTVGILGLLDLSWQSK